MSTGTCTCYIFGMYAGIYILCKYYGKGGGGEMVSWGKKLKRGKKVGKLH